MPDASLIVPAFIAGLLTFFAPCTFPMVPAYLSFIGGVSLKDLSDPKKKNTAKQKIVLNAFLYVLGFSVIFVALGSLVGFIGNVATIYQSLLARIGGVIVILFGLSMLPWGKRTFLSAVVREWRIPGLNTLQPGHPVTSLAFGAAFALGWTPCIGPVLGSILILAATTSTVAQGTFLLGVFSLGLAIPFLLIALMIGSATRTMSFLTRYLSLISSLGGVFLIFLGILMVTNSFGVWISFFYNIFGFISYDRLLDYL